MPEKAARRVHTEHALLDIGAGVGALIIYFRQELCGQQIDVSPKERVWQRTHTDVLERRVTDRLVFAALFLALPIGDYIIWSKNSHPLGEVTITDGQVAEVNWRHLLPEVFLASPASGSVCAPSQLPDILPPRYRSSKAVSAAPMGTAPTRYDKEGRVAWAEMWTDFCELALAGGPPHRGTLLEPVSPEEVATDRDEYERVIAEIKRGLELVTGLPVVIQSKQAGWIGLRCDNEEMALWLLRAIVVENVCVRREECVLWLPAGPAFQLEKEIKNVITVVAKTYHYWTEHARCK
ncbi:MAG: hypothetical protein M3Y39_04580 [Chloroflexota bacterium]|nr:hypothetical protein [Chloroflexota bacterium]